jgi:formylglycine-generating enzyme required for sulfatase activity
VQEQKLSQEQLPPQEQKPTFSTQQTPPLPTERGLGGEVFHNADWKPVIITFPDLKIPDMPFCLVPKGTFQMGEGKETHPQTFDEPFYIAQYPVTNAQWSEAVKAGVVKEPANVGEAWKWYKDPKMANTPVVGVNWYQCQSFAAWMGCRLPTEREWEYAARGVDNLIYPWGNEFIADNVVYRGNSRERPHVVTEKPNGASWVGASHLSGNVWEWCSSLYGSYPYVAWYRRENLTSDGRRILRGGSWGNHVSYLCAAHRDVNSPDDSYLNGSGIGFRCARSYLP